MRNDRLSRETAESLVEELITSGGFTYPRPPKTGYMVGGFGKRYMFSLDTYEYKEIRNAIIDVFVTNDIADYVGGWKGPISMEVEGSRHYLTRDMAIIAAKRNKQLAIYDLRRCESVTL